MQQVLNSFLPACCQCDIRSKNGTEALLFIYLYGYKEVPVELNCFTVPSCIWLKSLFTNLFSFNSKEVSFLYYDTYSFSIFEIWCCCPVNLPLNFEHQRSNKCTRQKNNRKKDGKQRLHKVSNFRLLNMTYLFISYSTSFLINEGRLDEIIDHKRNALY